MSKTVHTAPWTRKWQPFKCVCDAENSARSTLDTELAVVLSTSAMPKTVHTAPWTQNWQPFLPRER
eukprot:10745066-Lingulodinium_polyedra.AAC.1